MSKARTHIQPGTKTRAGSAPEFNMMFLNTLALGLLVSLNDAVPISTTSQILNQVFVKSKSNPDDVTSGAVGIDSYTPYHGDGSAASGWPGMDKWVSFQQMFDSNTEIMRRSCTETFQLPAGSDNSDEEIKEIWNAIQTAAQETGVDHRFILAVMMQESAGCVRVWTTHNSVDNPGIMQDHAGTYSCNRGAKGETWGFVNPCPADQIMGMIRDGVSGTTAGDGLAGLLNLAAMVARAYNSGQLDRTNLNVKFSSSRCYTMDIANRLTGWVNAAKQCTEW